jgi:hypothetical protein
MKTKTKATKKVSVRETHDRLTLTANYPTGGMFRFTIGRSGETLTWGGADPAAAKAETRAFMKEAELRGGESNKTRVERLKALAESVDSMRELAVKILSSQNPAAVPGFAVGVRFTMPHSGQTSTGMDRAESIGVVTGFDKGFVQYEILEVTSASMVSGWPVDRLVKVGTRGGFRAEYAGVLNINVI